MGWKKKHMSINIIRPNRYLYRLIQFGTWLFALAWVIAPWRPKDHPGVVRGRQHNYLRLQEDSPSLWKYSRYIARSRCLSRSIVYPFARLEDFKLSTAEALQHTLQYNGPLLDYFISLVLIWSTRNRAKNLNRASPGFRVSLHCSLTILRYSIAKLPYSYRFHISQRQS